MNVLETVNLTKKYGSFYAVKDVNFQVSSGEIFGFLGPNGAGKTTTINMLTGLLQPTTGKVYLDGQQFDSRSVESKRVFGYAPDEPVLYEKLTLSEFLDFIIRIYDLDYQAATTRAEELLELFELANSSYKLLGSFSRGMKQKASLVASLLPDPKIIILDEPTSGLDPRSVKRLKDLLTREAQRGKAVFMSTHILEIAEKMSHRIGIIQHGELKALGTMDELYSQKNQTPHSSQEDETNLEQLFLELTGGDEHEYLE
ncbi:ABC transporter ATP-binding protein [Natranaerobius thermophilus]|uniref:ABC transporter related n=1 Tax=Natranaerobius thermophilus (strain ATCC BAA-1301 / DSM 18059 / JW/NM-WN-LF) TaxID=457570 RepID=B2A6N1_NATTJ|nr:ABC transporter ATP-binding protein [Natranaerobius thermophilus]ACB84164.1 ABC transporter related [Natranaerobius thermophilus JW/NM-WN-LF]